jgi:hypothetical protein
MAKGHNDRNDLSRNDRSDSPCAHQNQSGINSAWLVSPEMQVRRCTMSACLSNAIKVLCACSGIAFVYWVFLHRPEIVPTALGWDGLISCSDSTSLDGTRRLSVSENSHAILYEAHRPSDRRRGNETISKEGTWSFDEISKRYLVVLNGETTTYLLVSPESGGMCMLIAGDVQSADLRQSWFSSPADDNHEPDDQGTGPDDR